jgi:NDP-sugar pyrophosphorylase family protein
MKIVILAGGKGTRLAPYTSVLPKPLMPIGNLSILEILVKQLAAYGFNDITLCVGYLSHLIQAVLTNGVSTNSKITYVHEPEPLGTAGPLSLVDGLDSTFLAMNGDVLTTLDYGELVRHHRESGNALTIAAHKRASLIDYGVLHLDAATNGAACRTVQAYEEKPQIPHVVSMGVYAIEPRTLDYIPRGEYFDFPDLVQALLRAGESVGAFLFDGLWLDIGRHEDYEQAVAIWEQEKHHFAYLD